MRKRASIVGLGSLVSIASIIFPSSCVLPPNPKDLPSGVDITSKENCEPPINNGVWKQWSRKDHALGRESCNLKSNDFRNACYDSSTECEGECFFDKCLDYDCTKVVGSCSEFRRNFGCWQFVEGGSYVGTECAD